MNSQLFTTSCYSRKYIGATSIMLVIIISAVLMSLTITSLYMAIDFSQFRSAMTARSSSEIAVKSCFEEGMRLIKYNRTITGSTTVDINDFTCNYTFTTIDSSHLEMDLDVTIDSSTQQDQVLVNILDNPLSYTYK